MTDEQRAALDALTAKRRAFVLAFIGEARGNATEAARRAGYAHPDPEGARLLGDARVAAAVEALRAPVEREAIATVDELRAMWTKWARTGAVERVIDGERVTEPLHQREMIKASELLARSQGAFIDRAEVTGKDGAPVGGGPTVLIAYDVLSEIARGGDDE